MAGDGEPSTSAASAHAGIAARAGDAEGSGQREPRATTAWAGEQVRFRRLFVFSSATACALRSENGPFFFIGGACYTSAACFLLRAACWWCAPSRSRLNRVRCAQPRRAGTPCDCDADAILVRQPEPASRFAVSVRGSGARDGRKVATTPTRGWAGAMCACRLYPGMPAAHDCRLSFPVGLLLQACHAHSVGAAATCKRIVFKGEWETVHKSHNYATELA